MNKNNRMGARPVALPPELAGANDSVEDGPGMGRLPGQIRAQLGRPDRRSFGARENFDDRAQAPRYGAPPLFHLPCVLPRHTQRARELAQAAEGGYGP